MLDRWVIVLALVLVAVFVVLALLPREVRLYRRANPRRGDQVDLGAPAIALGVDVARPAVVYELEDARPIPAGVMSSLQRCRPARGVHYHGAGPRCECGKVANVCSTLPGFAVHPLAGRGNDTAPGVWEQPCGECGRSPASLRYACEHCPRLTTPAMRREWRALQGFAATGDEAA